MQLGIFLSSPQSAAHRISELNLFLYLRISGVSLGGRVLVGLTFTIDPFLTSIFSCSNLEPIIEATIVGKHKPQQCDIKMGFVFL